MADVTYTITRDQKPTEDQVRMMEEGAKKQDRLLEAGRFDEVYDDDCPSTDPELNPEGYAALLKAVAERNRRLEEAMRKMA